jgi:hypothetical protein
MSGPTPKVHERYSFRVRWRDADATYVARVKEFPDLEAVSQLGADNALDHIMKRVEEEIARRIIAGDAIPQPEGSLVYGELP